MLSVTRHGAHSRRAFLTGATGTAACALAARGWAQAAAAHPPVMVAGKRVKTVDIHAHGAVDVTTLLAGTPLEAAFKSQMASPTASKLVLGPERLADMDAQGIDVHVVSISIFWDEAEEVLADKLCRAQNAQLAEACAAYSGRFVPMASVSLRYPQNAARQLEDACRQYGMRAVNIRASIEPFELSDPRFYPFWAKAEELHVLVFMHPRFSAPWGGNAERLKGNGLLTNIIGNPLESTYALAHLIFDGTLDRFPNLRLCTAHGGGFLPNYAGRFEYSCVVNPNHCKGRYPERNVADYLRRLYFDSIVLTPEGLRHLVAVSGPTQVMIGTDYPYGWSDAPVELVESTPTLSDAGRVDILGVNACKLLKIPLEV